MIQKTIFPKHVNDFLSLFHSIVFEGSDGEETWPQYLTLEQKECISLSLAIYYQCQHCINHHVKILSKLRNVEQKIIIKQVSSMILFLRTDISRISKQESQRWKDTWEQLVLKLVLKNKDNIGPWLVGLAIGIARDDDAFLDFFGKRVQQHYSELKLDIMDVVGELMSVVVFMKAAASKNRIETKLMNFFN